MERARRRAVVLSLVILGVLTGIGVGAADPRPVSTTGGHPGPNEHLVPAEWGDPIAMSSTAMHGLNTNVLFRAEDGTLRLVVLSGKKSWLEQIVVRKSSAN